MKLSTTVSALILSALASSTGADARNAGSRRSVQLGSNNASVGSSSNLVKRVSLAQMKESSDNMQKKAKRQPLPNAMPIAAAAGFGAIPSMNDGNMPIVGLSRRQHSFGEHNGKQGTSATTDNVVSDSNKSESSSATSSDSSDADAEECEEEDGDDDEDAEECEEGDSADDDDEECEEDDDDDYEEECTEDDEDVFAGSSDDTASGATANVNVNLKQSDNSGESSDSSPSNNVNLSKNRSSSSSADASKQSPSSADSSKQSSSEASKESESSSSADGESFTGTATWYTQNGNAGACGTVNPDSAKIIALYTSAYANGDNCGRSVVIKNLDDGTQTTATVADMCPSCGGPQDIDLSVGAFEAIDSEYKTHGVRNIEWYFTD